MIWYISTQNPAIVFFYEWPLIGSLTFFVAVSLIASTLFYLITHKLIKKSLNKPHERTGRVLFRTTASLLGLLLSFTFANQRVSYYKIKDSLEFEASQLVNIYLDLRMYDSDESVEIQEKLKHYVRSILYEDLNTEDENPFLTASMYIFVNLYKSIMEMEANTPLLKSNLVSDINQVYEYMQIKGYEAEPEPLYLIYIATFGFIVSSLLFSVYKPDRISISFFSLYNSFVAVVMYFIIMMNNPFLGPLRIQNVPFNILNDILKLS